MELIVFGLNHRTAPLEVREHWALSGDRHRATLRCLSDKIDDSEHVILCTCNRTEFYSIVPVDSSPLGPQIAVSPDQTEPLDGSRRGALRRLWALAALCALAGCGDDAATMRRR